MLKVTFWVWSFVGLVDWKSTGPRGQITGHLFVCVSLCMQLYVFFVLLGPWSSDITTSPVSVFDHFPPNNDCNDYWLSLHCTFGDIKILPQFTSLEKIRWSWNNMLHAKNLNSAIMHPTIAFHVKLKHSAAISKYCLVFFVVGFANYLVHFGTFCSFCSFLWEGKKQNVVFCPSMGKSRKKATHLWWFLLVLDKWMTVNFEHCISHSRSLWSRTQVYFCINCRVSWPL